MIRTLLVDDDRFLLEALDDALKQFGFQVVTAMDGTSGAERYSRGCFDVVVTDIEMPGLSGIEMARHVRGSNRPSTPVIGMSATPWRLEQGDFDATLCKPFSLTDLIGVLNRLSGRTPSACAAA